jgi:hypothetical protein
MKNPSGILGRTQIRAGRWAWHFSALVAVGGGLLAACSTGSSKDGTQPSVATALSLLTAPPASFVNRATISPAPVVQLVDASGDPVATAGISVTAVLSSGTGALVGTTSGSSNTAGQVTFSNLAIGGATGAKTIQFTSSGLTPVSTGSLTLTAGAPSSVVANSTPASTGLTGTAVGTLPSVRVTDQDANPVPGVTVSFAVTAGGGNATAATPTTDAAGVATVGSWTLGGSAGTNTLTATVAALPAVSFNVTAGQAGVAAALQIQTQPPATAQDRATFGTAPVVQLVDVVGSAVNTAGVAVTVALMGGGTLSGTASVNTDAAGQAAFGGLSIAGTVGNRQLQFASAGLVGATSGAIALTPGAAANLVANSTQNQSGFTGSAVTTLPSVKVTDLDGNGVSGIGVTFAVTAGGGSLTGATPNTNGSGVATVGSWTLGGAPGTNTVTAVGTSVSLAGAPVAFNASGNAVTGNYTLTLQNIGPALTANQQAAFDNAKARWQAAVTGDLVDVNVNGFTTSANCGAQTLSGSIDDLLIFIKVSPIDGQGGILGQAGPCYLRSGGGLTVIGLMNFDSADLVGLEANGLLNDVILHEMGHVLGFGSLWEPFGTWTLNLLQVSSGASTLGFFGATGLAAYTGFNGGGSATTVPVEDTAVAGTGRSHWKEGLFKNEVMTGYLSGSNRPLSRTSIQSLADLGYSTNPAVADPYDVNTASNALRANGVELPPVQLLDDVLDIPLSEIDPATGRVTPLNRRSRP